MPTKVVPSLLIAAALLPNRAPAQTDSTGASITPFPFFFYTPETELAFGATVIAFAKLGGSERASLLQPTFVYTTKKQIIVSLYSEAYVQSDLTRMLGEASYSLFPNSFWGIGNDTPDNLEENYTPRIFYFSGDLQRSVALGWFVGINVRAAHRTLTETTPGGLLASGLTPGSRDGLVVNLGVSAARDTRDRVSYPRRGSFYQTRLSRADGALGSDFDYTVYELDLRQYLTTAPGHVLVFRAYTLGVDGVPPFDLLPQIGGEFLLRAYYAGRYRDDALLALQTEYRLPVWWRFGVVGFVGTGQVAPSYGDMTFDALKPSAGFGLRFLLDETEGVNLRADFAVGDGSSGFYLGMGEVF